MQKRISFAAIAAILAAGPALAGGKAPAEGCESCNAWEGGYIGFTLGGSSFDASTSRTITNNTYWTANNGAAVEAASAVNFEDDAFLAGFTAGYNWGLGWAVFGIEGDFNANSVDVSSSRLVVYPDNAPDTFTTTTRIDQDWLATLRARFGVDLGGAMIYATGGLAVADITFTQTFQDTVTIPFTALSEENSFSGWTAGGGVEVPVFKSASLKLEYLRVDLGEQHLRGSTLGVTNPATLQDGVADIEQDIIRAGMNWKLN